MSEARRTNVHIVCLQSTECSVGRQPCREVYVTIDILYDVTEHVTPLRVTRKIPRTEFMTGLPRRRCSVDCNSACSHWLLRYVLPPPVVQSFFYSLLGVSRQKMSQKVQQSVPTLCVDASFMWRERNTLYKHSIKWWESRGGSLMRHFHSCYWVCHAFRGLVMSSSCHVTQLSRGVCTV